MQKRPIRMPRILFVAKTDLRDFILEIVSATACVVESDGHGMRVSRILVDQQETWSSQGGVLGIESQD